MPESPSHSTDTNDVPAAATTAVKYTSQNNHYLLPVSIAFAVELINLQAIIDAFVILAIDLHRQLKSFYPSYNLRADLYYVRYTANHVNNT